jgi:hypothetical protein
MRSRTALLRHLLFALLVTVISISPALSVAAPLTFEFSGVVEDPFVDPPDLLGLAGTGLTGRITIDSDATASSDDGIFGAYDGTSVFSSSALSAPLAGPGELIVEYGTGVDALIIFLPNPTPDILGMSFRLSFGVGPAGPFPDGSLPVSLPPPTSGIVIQLLAPGIDDNRFGIGTIGTELSASVTPVPEPATISLLTIGLFCLVRKKFRS